ncbi:MAG: transcription elongation factor GreA [Thiohalomonadales bacterium]
MTTKVPITARGAKLLQEELKHLKFEVRPRIIKAIAVAREHGDLKENAEYHAAREQQSFAEGRIADIEGKLSNAEVIDISKLSANGRIVFGATVDLADEGNGDKVTYQIVGEDEADIKKGLVSITSPIARALIGQEEGEVVVVRAPGGEHQYEVMDVRYD